METYNRNKAITIKILEPMAALCNECDDIGHDPLSEVYLIQRVIQKESAKPLGYINHVILNKNVLLPWVQYSKVNNTW